MRKYIYIYIRYVCGADLHVMTDKRTGIQADKPTGGQTDKGTDRHEDRRTGGQTDMWADGQEDR